jgi:hypothetical protein
MVAFTKRNARLAPGGLVKSKCTSYRSYCVTGCGPTQVYEILKHEFVVAHHDCLQHEYEGTCRHFARRTGL